jgi:hypothetical protein
LLPTRANPVAGALVATIVFALFLAPPVLILGVIVWLVVRAIRSSSLPAKPEMDAELSARFHELEESILNANAVDTQGKKLARKRPAGSRRRGRQVRDR